MSKLADTGFYIDLGYGLLLLAVIAVGLYAAFLLFQN